MLADSREEVEELLRQYPLFCLLDKDSIQQLSLLFKKVQFNPAEVVFRQGDLIDYLYLIQAGNAEVTKKIARINVTEEHAVAVLDPGDGIGLSTSGLFSQTGFRKATIIAKTPLTLFAIHVDSFNVFLQDYSELYPAIKMLCDKILLIRLLRESSFFQSVSFDVIRQLAFNANKIQVKKGTVIFQEDNDADVGYCLLSGQVRIFTSLKKETQTIKVLDAPCIFGEAGFLNNEKRNSSAEAMTDCEIISLAYKDIEAIMGAESKFSTDLILSRIEQLRPVPLADVVVNKENKLSAVLMRNNVKINLNPQEYQIWKALNGITPLINIKNKFNLSIQDLYFFILKMHTANFLEMHEVQSNKPKLTLSSFPKYLVSLIRSYWRNK